MRSTLRIVYIRQCTVRGQLPETRVSAPRSEDAAERSRGREESATETMPLGYSSIRLRSSKTISTIVTASMISTNGKDPVKISPSVMR